MSLADCSNQPDEISFQSEEDNGDIYLLPDIECVHCHAIENKIKNHASDKVKKL